MNLGLLICTFNRPEYLKQCLDSIKRADIPEGTIIMIHDDHSTDLETIKIINDYSDDRAEVVKLFRRYNGSIKNALLWSCDGLFEFSKVDVIINLDSDAIVRNDFIKVLLNLKGRFYSHIITGFNCLTKNKDGTERHQVLMQGNDYNLKKSVGGLNMLFDKSQYQKWVRPALVKSLEQNLNWDDHTCRASMADGKEIVCACPSVCQHIGFDSSMGHSGEPTDVADDFIDDEESKLFERVIYSLKEESAKETILKHFIGSILNIPNVTLICADGFDLNRVIHSANISCRNIEFGAVKILSNFPSNDPRVIKIRPIIDKKDYSQFVLKEMVNYVDTDYMMIFQYDGFPINHLAWSEEFLKWDMVGAAWKFRAEKRTANGGFSLRSKKMMEAIRDDDAIYLQNDNIISNYAEDHVLFYIYREYLEQKHEVKIAPEEICDKFSFEAWGLNPPDNKYNGSFGFHGFSVDFNDADLPYVPYKLPNRQIL